jgi:hypothetical protein
VAGYKLAEQPVFWLGGKPGNKDKGREPPKAERYEPSIRDACSSCGYEVDEYVAAQGGFGGWLAHLYRDGQHFRVFWSGKDNRITFDQAQGHGGWAELATAEVADDGVPAFVESIKTLLGKQAAG